MGLVSRGVIMTTENQIKMLSPIQTREAEPNKADEPWRICPQCGGYPLVLEGVGFNLKRVFCDFCTYADSNEGGNR